MSVKPSCNASRPRLGLTWHLASMACATLFVCTAVRSQDASVSSITTDRPAVTESSVVVPQGRAAA